MSNSNGTSTAIAVIGGAGFIGSVTAATFLEQGYQNVIVIDNLSQGHRAAIPRTILDRQNLVVMDICAADARDALTAVFKRFQVGAIVQFAASISVGEGEQKPRQYWHNNFDGTRNVADAAAAAGVPALVFSSTAAAYAMPKNGELLAETDFGPTSVYGQTKVASQLYLQSLARPRANGGDGINVIAFHYFNAAGAHQARDGQWYGEDHSPETHLVPQVLMAAEAFGLDRTLKIFGTDWPTPDGTCVRDYIHVADLAAAHVRATEMLLTMNGAGSYQRFNLGTGTGHSVLEVVTEVERVLGCPVRRETAPRRDGDTAVLVANPARAEQVLQWKAARTLHDIIESAAAFKRQFPSGYPKEPS